MNKSMQVRNSEDTHLLTSSTAGNEHHNDVQGHLDEQRYTVEDIQAWIVAKLAEYLHMKAGDIDIHEPFATYGLASVDAVGLSGELEEWLGRELAPTLLYDYPSIESLGKYLVAGSNALEAQGYTRPEVIAEPIAI